MDKIKSIYNKGKLAVMAWVILNWTSDKIFNKGKVIFAGVVLFFLLVKLVYSIFS